MSSFNSKLLRFMGYATAVILFLVVIITIYLIYSLMSSSPFNQDTPPATNMEQDLQDELNKNNQLNPNDPNSVLVPPPNSNALPPPDSNYQSPNSKIPDGGTYNPFEDNNVPVTEDPSKIPAVPSGSNPDGVEDLPLNIQPSQTDQGSGSDKNPIDPTKKTPQNNLDILF